MLVQKKVYNIHVYLYVSAYFNRLEEQCKCPIPCRRTLFDPTITYATVSNYDTDIFMRSGVVANLASRFLSAREKQQRVNENTLTRDRQMIRNLNGTYNEMSNNVFGHYGNTIEKIVEAVNVVMSDLRMRVAFHRRWGLEKLQYTVEHNFIRGWNVMDERTFAFVTSNYQEIGASMRYALPKIANETETNTWRIPRFLQVESELFQRQILAKRALANLSSVFSAYHNATPLLSYKVTPNSRYDLSYITPAMILKDNDLLELYSSKLNLRLNQYLQSIADMLQILDDALENPGSDNFSSDGANQPLENAIYRFEKAARSYLYYRFVFQDRIAYKPLELTSEVAERFNKAFEMLEDHQAKLRLYLSEFRDSLDKADLQWSLLGDFVDLCNNYSPDESAVTKSQLAKIVSTESMHENVNHLKAFSSQLRSRSREILGLLSEVRHAAVAVWRSMINEDALKPFYAKLHSDIQLCVSNSTSAEESEKLVRGFRYMINAAHGWDLTTQTVAESLERLSVWMNADFAVLGNDVTNDVTERFDEAQALLRLDSTARSEEEFFLAFHQLRVSLEAFAQANNIDETFFR